MATKRRDADATRARLLRAATQEFARLGYAGARGDSIARRAHSSERMLYYYYGSKEGLFRAVLESAYLSLQKAERELRIDHLPPREALDEFCRFVWRYYLDHPEFIGLVNSENLQQARHLRKSAQLGELVAPVVGLLSQLLASGVASGEFRDGIDPVELYITIAALGYFYLSNQHTLSAVLGRDLRDPRHLQAHWQASAEVVRCYVARS
ncbi:MAG TPA: TetR/AcrR family transcriptional regulator [Burkholderiaceae bacterium]|nr:TetR/AcrR family transcriptional regulator [Burkholderiaceae bacterium]